MIWKQFPHSPQLPLLHINANQKKNEHHLGERFYGSAFLRTPHKIAQSLMLRFTEPSTVQSVMYFSTVYDEDICI